MEHLAYMALKEAKFDAIPAMDILHKMTGAELEKCSGAIEDYFRYPSMLMEAMRDDAYSALKETHFETMLALNKLHEMTGVDLQTCSDAIENFYRDCRQLISAMQDDVSIALKATENDVTAAIKKLHEHTGVDMQVCSEAVDYFLSASTLPEYDLDSSEEINSIDVDYTIAKCDKCHQMVPFDQKQRVCFCLYCGAPITKKNCIQDESDSGEDLPTSNDDWNQVIGIVQDEFPLTGHGLIVTTELEENVSIGDRITFFSSDGDRMEDGEILGIENGGKLFDTASKGMSVGLLVGPESLHDLIGTVIIFDR